MEAPWEPRTFQALKVSLSQLNWEHKDPFPNNHRNYFQDVKETILKSHKKKVEVCWRSVYRYIWCTTLAKNIMSVPSWIRMQMLAAKQENEETQIKCMYCISNNISFHDSVFYSPYKHRSSRSDLTLCASNDSKKKVIFIKGYFKSVLSWLLLNQSKNSQWDQNDLCFIGCSKSTLNNWIQLVLCLK